jgi:hypothetical protein
MPIRKFRSIEEMSRNQSLWRQPGDPELYRAMALVWTIARQTNPRHFRPGVYKFRSIEAMNAAQEAALTEHIRGLRQKRRT